jgi:hypothetical protein
MPDNPWIWVLALVIAAAVLFVALRRGGKVEAGVGSTKLKFEARKEPGTTGVSVLDQGTIENSTVGDVTGVAGGAEAAGESRVEVAKGATITGSTVGDLTGVRAGGDKAGRQ